MSWSLTSNVCVLIPFNKMGCEVNYFPKELVPDSAIILLMSTKVIIYAKVLILAVDVSTFQDLGSEDLKQNETL